MKKDKAIIVGGGITGLCSAYYLLEAGWEVELVDQGDLTNNCSFGNAGMIVPSHFVPLAAPGVVSQGVRWLFNKHSPFFLKFSLDPTFLSWGFRFLRHANQEHMDDSVSAILDLNLLGKKEYRALTDTLDFSYVERGIFMLYKTAAMEKEQLELAEIAEELKVDCRVLSSEEIQELEADIPLSVKGGVWYTSDAWIDPPEIMTKLLDFLKKKGLTVHPYQTIDRLEMEGQQVRYIFSKEQVFQGDKFIFANGADLGTLAKRAKINIPVMPGKGYSFMTDNFEGKLQHAALLLDDKVSITPMGNQVRIGGTMELGPKDHRYRKTKVQGMVNAVNRYYPQVGLKEPDFGEVWHGFRPCSPDGLPYIGNSTQFENVVIAGGAGMMGMSCGPAFGKLVAELIEEKPTSLNIDKFDPERFN